MKKKITILTILAVFMLITISIVSATNTQNTKQKQKKESPLYKLKTNNAIGEKTNKIKENYLKNRIYLRLPSFNLNDESGMYGGKHSTLPCTEGRICNTLFCKTMACKINYNTINNVCERYVT